MNDGETNSAAELKSLALTTHPGSGLAVTNASSERIVA